MDNWIKARKKIKIFEILAVCVALVLILIGLCGQLNSHSYSIFGPIIDNIDQNFTLVILQIQVTVGTLTISIIALISGSISDAKMGIVFSDY